MHANFAETNASDAHESDRADKIIKALSPISQRVVRLAKPQELKYLPVEVVCRLPTEAPQNDQTVGRTVCRVSSRTIPGRAGAAAETVAAVAAARAAGPGGGGTLVDPVPPRRAPPPLSGNPAAGPDRPAHQYRPPPRPDRTVSAPSDWGHPCAPSHRYWVTLELL